MVHRCSASTVTRRDAGSIRDPETNKIRVMSAQCLTCVFRPGNPMKLRPGRLKDIIDSNRDGESLLTCHQTLPYGGHPELDPAACHGFFERYGRELITGRLALMLGLIRVDPPE